MRLDLLDKESVKSSLQRVLLELISVYSPSGKEFLLRDSFAKISEMLGLEVRETESHSFILGDSNAKILLASHADTVTGFLKPLIDNSKIWGRGAVDAKGPLASMIVATSILRDKGIDVTVAALSDEEASSRGAKELVEKGQRFKYVIIGEPTSTYGVGVEYRGVIHLNIECDADAGHASSVSKNLIVQLSDIVSRAYVPPKDYDTVSVTPTIIKAGETINVVPSNGYLHFDIRFSIKNKAEAIIKQIQDIIPSNCRFSITELVEPIKVDVNSELVRSVMYGIFKSGGKPQLVRKMGTSDMNILSKISEQICAYGPGNSLLEHTNNEVITLDELFIGTSTYVNAIEKLCGEADC